MTLSLVVPPNLDAKLRERAAESGETVADYASRVLADAVAAPSIDEILEPIRADFAKSGMSGDKILDLGHQELANMRADKRAGK